MQKQRILLNKRKIKRKLELWENEADMFHYEKKKK